MGIDGSILIDEEAIIEQTRQYSQNINRDVMAVKKAIDRWFDASGGMKGFVNRFLSGSEWAHFESVSPSLDAVDLVKDFEYSSRGAELFVEQQNSHPGSLFEIEIGVFFVLKAIEAGQEIYWRIDSF
jgi:hypothetical protein